MRQIALGAFLGGLGVFMLFTLRGPVVVRVPVEVRDDNVAGRQVVSAEPGAAMGVVVQERTEATPLPTDAAAEAGTSPDTSPALLGVVAPAPLPVDAVEPRFNNDGAMLLYKMMMLKRQKCQERIERGESLTEAQLDAMAINEAVVTCMNQQRFYYLGPASLMPAYSHLQSANTRYIATVIQDQGIIIELTRGEFPGVFEHYDFVDLRSK
ncbi:MAG: hypothetical protein R3F29_14015 [Planctomycetota bacterium]